MSRNRINVIVDSISRAFADVRCPSDDNLVVKREGSFSIEQNALAALFKNRHWSSLTLDELHNTEAGLLTGSGFHCFIPAYLTIVLENYADSDVLPEYTLFWLDPTHRADVGEFDRLEDFRKRLTRLQAQSIRCYIRYLQREHGTDLKRYGFQFDKLLAYYHAGP